MENIYVQFDGMVYQQIVGIPMGTNCAPLIADLFRYCYERDFMSNLQKSKWFVLKDKFNDTSRYIDDIFTIIKWSGISPSFARLWLAETAFTRVYLRVNWPQMLNDGLFGVSVMS